jgi:hypothetical protein
MAKDTITVVAAGWEDLDATVRQLLRKMKAKS